MELSLCNTYMVILRTTIGLYYHIHLLKEFLYNIINKTPVSFTDSFRICKKLLYHLLFYVNITISYFVTVNINIGNCFFTKEGRLLNGKE